MKPLRRPALLLLTAFVLAPAAWGQRARRRPRTPPPAAPSTEACQATLRGELDGLRNALAGCVMRRPGFERGQVRVRVTVDAHGTLVNLETAAHINGALDDTANQCVEGAVRAVHLTGCPSSSMSEAEKTWSFAAVPRPQPAAP
jgi:hypothetical protein